MIASGRGCGAARQRPRVRPHRLRFAIVAVWLAVTSVSPVGCRCGEGRPAEADVEAGAASREMAAAEPAVEADDATPAARPGTVRPSTLAGSWYPASPTELRDSVARYLDHVDEPVSLDARALIVPHAGHRWSGQTAAYAYQTVRGRHYRRVFILAPSHRVWLSGAAVPTVSAFETPLGDVPVDTEVTEALAERPGIAMDDAPHAAEHAVEIQLPFLQVALRPGFRIVPIVIGELNAEGAQRLAGDLRPFLGPEDLVVASSDFTHYGERFDYVPFTEDIPENLERLDMGALDAIRTLSPAALESYRRRTGITVCGYRPIMVLMALLPESAEMRLLHYETSGEQTGDYDNSVSYLAVAATGPGWAAEGAGLGGASPVVDLGGPPILTPEEQAQAVRLARTSLEDYVRFGRTPDPRQLGLDLDGPLGEDYGVFVTLKTHGRLRGCIGNIWPVEPLAEAIVGRAVDAAVNDRRFRPVTAGELGDIDVEVSVLTVPEPVDSYRDIELGRHGIVLERGGRRAVFLPQVAPEQGWTLEETLTELSRKAGLPPSAWRSGARFEVFEAQVFAEAAP